MAVSLRFFTFALVGAVLIGCQTPPADDNATAPTAETDTARTAVATITPIGDEDIAGRITFEETGDFMEVRGTIRGLSEGKHGLHVHAGTTCTERGDHFNPTNAPHGSPDEPSTQRHVGDLGNLVAENDTARYERVDRVIQLSGPQSIAGHVLVVHQGEDLYIPQPSGDSGDQIGCGVIELQNGAAE